ncbi:MliC family protein [Terricaulis sp.]|uniref:MliC family protein n=1 Tax=Terricaulis sp. TaxID=2768686 RepID=UPI003784927D
MKKLLLAAAVLTLAACASTPAAAPGNRVDWRCDGGAAFSARINGSGNAEVFAGGQVYTLPGVAAGSGTRYTNGSVEYWEHGGEATLGGAAGGPYNNCRR